MKAIQSFWSKPAFHGMQNFSNSRKFGGWLNFRYFLISSALSCLTIRKQQKSIELYTDDLGAELLIELMGLPFDDVSLVLNELKEEDHRLWILGKMKAIGLQENPFVHIDNDIFLWEPLPYKSSPNYLITQSKSPIWLEYKLSINEIFANFKFIPACFQKRPTDATMIDNVGVIGGNDVAFFKSFHQTSTDFLEQNKASLSHVGLGGLNQMIEEYLFTCMVRHEKRDVTYVLELSNPSFAPSPLKLNLAPLVYKYIHLIGNNKANHFFCEQLELRLAYEFPEFYKKVINAISEFPNAESNPIFTERHNQLMKTLQVLYTKSWEQVLKMKISWKSGIEISPATDFIGTDLNYLIREINKSSEGNWKLLPRSAYDAISHWQHYFQQPVCLGEIIEDLRQKNNGTEDELAKLKSKVINAIFVNLVLLGTLKFN